VVGVQVRDEDVGDVREADRLRELALGALAAVEEDAVAAPAHEDRRHAAAGRRSGGGGAGEEQREVHRR
jgi:hypothetical protein